MNDKTGRNDLCHCGSGKKYKKCCLMLLPSSKTAEIIDLAWRKLRKLENKVFDQHLIPYVTKELPDDVLQCAFDDFLPEDSLPDALDKELLFHHFFIPWFLFNWVPGDAFFEDLLDSEATLAQNYVSAHGSKLTSQSRRFIDTMSQTYYSFYSILQVKISQSLLIKDLLLGTICEIKERQGSHQLERGDIVFGRILTMDKQSGAFQFCR